MNNDISKITESMKAWQTANPEQRAVIMIAVDATCKPLYEASMNVSGKQSVLIDSLKIALSQRDNSLAELTTAAVKELSDGLTPIGLNLN